MGYRPGQLRTTCARRVFLLVTHVDVIFVPTCGPRWCLLRPLLCCDPCLVLCCTRESLRRDGLLGLVPPGAAWSLARYNDPSTPGPFRRNEVLLPLTDVDMEARYP